MMKNNKERPKKYKKVSTNIFLWTQLTDLWRNMFQTLERRWKYSGIILSDELILMFKRTNLFSVLPGICILQIPDLNSFQATWNYSQQYRNILLTFLVKLMVNYVESFG